MKNEILNEAQRNADEEEYNGNNVNDVPPIVKEHIQLL